jgi:hypothetical protein
VNKASRRTDHEDYPEDSASWADPYARRERFAYSHSEQLPILRDSQIREHEEEVRAFSQEIGVQIESLESSNKQPPQKFTLNRPRNERHLNAAPTLALSTEEAKEIFSDSSQDEEVDDLAEEAPSNTHIHGFLAQPKSHSNYVQGSEEDGGSSSSSILSTIATSASAVRRRLPSGLRGGSLNKEEIEASKVKGGGYKMLPRGDRWNLDTKEERLKKARLEREFLLTLTPDELALNAAQREGGFRIEDFGREPGRNWSVNESRRFQTAFNRKRRDFEQQRRDDPTAGRLAMARELVHVP